MADYPLLEYRGNYQLTVGADFAGTYLRADFLGGYSVTESVTPGGLLYGKLNYSALSSRVFVQPSDAGAPVDRLTYFWNFYQDSMVNGKRPFTMRLPRPLKGSLYLWEFVDDQLELSLIDQFLATAGIQVRQTFVKGMNFLPDGSLSDDVLNTQTI